MFRATAKAAATIFSRFRSPPLTWSMIALASRVRVFTWSTRLGLILSIAASRAAFINEVVTGSNTFDSKRSGIAVAPFAALSCAARRFLFRFGSLSFRWCDYGGTDLLSRTR